MMSYLNIKQLSHRWLSVFLPPFLIMINVREVISHKNGGCISCAQMSPQGFSFFWLFHHYGCRISHYNFYTIFLLFCFQQSNMVILCIKQHSKTVIKMMKKSSGTKKFLSRRQFSQLFKTYICNQNSTNTGHN